MTNAPNGSRRLRVAVATDAPVATWQAQCVEQLAAVPGVEIVGWITLPRRVPFGLRQGVAAFAPAETPETLHVLSAGSSRSLTPAPQGAADVLLDLVGLPHDLSAAAPEIWRFGYGRGLRGSAALEALHDYVHGTSVTRVALLVEPGARVIREGWVLTASWWTGTPVDRILMDASGWPAVAARERLDSDSGAPPQTGDGDRHRLASGPLRSTAHSLAAGPPSPPTVVLRGAAVARRVVDAAEALLHRDNWNIGIIDAPIVDVVRQPSHQDITWLPERPGFFMADPFGIERDGVLHVFFEEYSERVGHGRIGHLAIEPGGRISEPTCVLDPGLHASYPFLIEHGGRVFMLPEMAASGSQLLFEAESFPDRWRPVATLIPDVPVADAVAVEYDGRWWLFATRSDRGVNQNLYVWHAPELFGPWTPHDSNPVKTDARCARSGGTPFVHEGRLYRPSQDDSRSYGCRVIVNRVDSLTPGAFRERPVVAVEPRPWSLYPSGLHTLSAAGSRTLVDGNRRALTVRSIRGDLRRRLPGVRHGLRTRDQT